MAKISEAEKIRQESWETYRAFGIAAALRGKAGMQGELNKIGVRDFKRRVLGLCGTQRIMLLDELADVLVEMRIVDSKEKAKNEFIPRLLSHHGYGYGCDNRLLYDSLHSKREIAFYNAVGPGNVKACQIKVR